MRFMTLGLLLTVVLGSSSGWTQELVWKDGRVELSKTSDTQTLRVGPGGMASWTDTNSEWLVNEKTAFVRKDALDYLLTAGEVVVLGTQGLVLTINDVKFRCTSPGRLVVVEQDGAIRGHAVSGTWAFDAPELPASKAQRVAERMMASFRQRVGARSEIGVDLARVKEELKLEMESFEEAGVVSVEAGAACLDSSGTESSSVQNENVNTQIDATQAGLRVIIEIPTPQR